MADKRNRTPFYGAVPTSSLHADHVFMADGESVQDALTEKYELLDTITLEEDVNSILYTCSHPIKKLIILFEIEASTGNSYIRIDNNESPVIIYSTVLDAIKTTKQYSLTLLDSSNGFNINYTVIGSTSIIANMPYYTQRVSWVQNDKYEILHIFSLTPSILMPTGSIIQIYGIPA